jgi:predicted nucleic acid-binding protein
VSFPIDFLEGRAPAANRVALELDRGQLRTTVITRFELLAGAKTARQLKLVGELLAALPCLPLDEPGADTAAEICRTLERDGWASAWATASSPGSWWPTTASS